MEPGRTLAHYRLIEPIGRGGMGIVWRAHDARLERDVAIKVLPPASSADPEIRERFEREARAVAALNHPNICVVYDVGSDDELDFIVMELVEGTTLAGRLEAGPLPLPDAIRAGVEIARALHDAHQLGVVHRDLKPANIMLTRRGVKLLDFGLAKRVPAAAGARAEDALTTAATSSGRVLGTLPYMAPEQLHGGPVDARTDIFALGGVLHEMITGRRPFEAATQPGLIASIVAGATPSVLTHRPDAPPFLDRLVTRCLAKSPDHRWPSALELADALDWIAGKPDPAPPRRQRTTTALGIEYFRSRDGAMIAAARGGSGPPLFVVPTMVDTIDTSWAAYAAAFPDHDVVLYDRRGSGLSERGWPAEAADTYLQDAQSVVDGFELSSFDLLGTLLGSIEAASVAAAQRDRVGRLVLRSPVIGVADWAQIPVVRAALAALEHDWEFFTEAFSQLVVGWGHPAGHALAGRFRQVTTRDELRALLHAYARVDLMPAYAGIRAQTLVEHHPTYFFPAAYSRTIASMIAGCRMVIYRGREGEFMSDLSAAREFLTGHS